MSSINRYFTLPYAQPAEYQFSHDSVFLARRVFEIILSRRISYERVMDLCAGCGVVGIDLLVHLQNAGLELPRKIDFLEVQSIYHQFFAQNISQVQQVRAFEFMTLNYAEVSKRNDLHEQYDLILCNPPYFDKDRGVLSNSDFKNRCRFFIDSDFDNLMRAFKFLLKPTGSAYVLLKDLEQNGISLKERLHAFSQFLKFTPLEKIRTTDVYHIQRLS